MNKRKLKILTVAALVICLAITAAGTLAYFTGEDTAHNVIASGSVGVEIHEWADLAATVPYPEEAVSGVMPGARVTKLVEVENTGSGSAWVRVAVTKAIELAEGVEAEAELSLVTMDIDTANWTEKDGWYYYNAALGAGETTKPLFTAVSFALDMGNEYQDSVATVDVTAQAVQTANNGLSALDAAGWPET